MSNDELRKESEELLSVLLNSLNDENIVNPQSSDFDSVNEIISGISITRARQGFSPKETGNYIFSLREALLGSLHKDFNGEANELLSATLQVIKLVDTLAAVTFETSSKEEKKLSCAKRMRSPRSQHR